MSQSPAKQVFETLRSWKHLAPRRWKTVPIGGSRRNPELQQLHDGLASLYHDLGVLVFAGSSVSQTRRIGEVIQNVVKRGGPGATMSRLTGRVLDVQLQLPKSLEQCTYPKLGHDPLIRYRPRKLLDHGAKLLSDLLQGRLHEAYPSLGHVQLQELYLRSNTSIFINSTLYRPPAVRTVSGLRTLPLEAFVTLNGSLSKSQVKGNVLFAAKGTGSVVSAIEIVYKIWHKPQGSHRYVEFVDAEDKVDSPDIIRGSDRKSAATYAANEVIEEILRPLWQLESEIWAVRVSDIIKGAEKHPTSKRTAI